MNGYPHESLASLTSPVTTDPVASSITASSTTISSAPTITALAVASYTGIPASAFAPNTITALAPVSNEVMTSAKKSN
ncbi:hypothetical protein FACUT_11920, partial [Fusarium acutatum]